jgi:hypothetical protein
MLSSPLIETLRSFEEVELKQLDRFVHSKYFYHEDNASGVILLFEYLSQFAPLFQSDELKRGIVAKKLKQSDDYVVKIASNLHGVVKRFISVNYAECQKDEFWNQIELMRYYYKRGMIKQFESLELKLRKELDSNKFPSEKYLNKRCVFEGLVSDFEIKYDHSDDLNILNAMHEEERAYALKKAKLTFLLLRRSGNISINTVDIDKNIKELEVLMLKDHIKNIPLCVLYYNAILLRINGVKKNNLNEFRIQFESHEKLVEEKDSLALNGLIRQILIAQYNKGDVSCTQLMFETYQKHLYKGLLYAEGKILSGNLRNIVQFGIMVGQLKWVGKFLDIHQNRMGGSKNAQEVFDLSNAYYLLNCKRYEEAEKILSFSFDDAVHKVYARRIEVMVMYETGFDGIDYKIDSFRKMVGNAKELPEAHKVGNNNFALVMRKLIDSKTQGNEKRILGLKEDIKNIPTVEPVWLLNKLEDLRKKKRWVS